MYAAAWVAVLHCATGPAGTACSSLLLARAQRLPGYGADGDEDDARRKPAHPRSSVLGADGEAQRASACPHNDVCNTPTQPLRFGPTERSRRESEEWAESRCRCGMGGPSLSSNRGSGRSLMAFGPIAFALPSAQRLFGCIGERHGQITGPCALRRVGEHRKPIIVAT